MTERRKEALILLAIAIPALSFAAIKFEFSGVSNTGLAVAISIAGVFGLLGVVGGLIMLFTKNRLGIFDVKEPETKMEKEMSEIKDAITKEKPVEKSSDDITEEVTQEVTQSESIGLMKREKVLVERVSELNGFLNETETKLSQVRENLETKGWVNSDSGWVIE